MTIVVRQKNRKFILKWLHTKQWRIGEIARVLGVQDYSLFELDLGVKLKQDKLAILKQEKQIHHQKSQTKQTVPE